MSICQVGQGESVTLIKEVFVERNVEARLDVFNRGAIALFDSLFESSLRVQTQEMDRLEND